MNPQVDAAEHDAVHSTPQTGAHVAPDTAAQHAHTAPWRQTVGGALGELLRSTPNTQQSPSCRRCSEREQHIADLHSQLNAALKQRDEACTSLNVQRAAWEASQHALHEEQRLATLQRQQHMDAGVLSPCSLTPGHNPNHAVHQQAMQDLQQQLQHATSQRDAAQHQASTLQQQLDEQTTFLQLVLTRFEGALAAVNAMENHCAEMDAHADAVQRDWGRRLAALQQRHDAALHEAHEEHAHALAAMQRQHDAAVQEATTRVQQQSQQLQAAAAGDVQRLQRELAALREAQAGVVVDYEARLARLAKQAADTRAEGEQRCAELRVMLESKSAELRRTQHQSAEHAGEAERLRKKMKKCVAAIKALEGARCKLERAVADEAARHRHAEAAAAASRLAQDATEALLQQSLEAAAALHQRLAAVELQVGAQQGKALHSTRAASPESSPGIAAVRAAPPAAVGDPQVHTNPLFASRGNTSVAGTLPSSVTQSGGGTASPASRAASVTLSSIAVKLKELQRHLAVTPIAQR